jgi:23S rRNA (pseudouridine1915-N3)-methyltransferase
VEGRAATSDPVLGAERKPSSLGSLKLAVHYFSRGRCAWADEAAADYTRRLNRYAPFQENKHKPDGHVNRDRAQSKEAHRILNKLGSRDQLIVLDERGQGLQSVELAALIENAALDGTGVLHFAIGGAYGHHQDLRQKAHKIVKLSDLVLNHQIARVLLLEQLYRAWTILKKEPYHHA